MSVKRILALVLAAMLAVSAFGCASDDTPAESKAEESKAEESKEESTAAESSAEESDAEGEETEYTFELKNLDNFEYGVDYEDLYGHMKEAGVKISLADVTEDPETGLAFINYDGEEYELGMDFLSMAMVYNCDPEGTEFETEDEVYAAWWKYYITRWNYLLPEIPLYSNEYYDLYNAQITGVEENPTNPFWSPAAAVIDWASEKEDNSFIMGSSTDLSGQFRYSNFGKSSPGSSDLDVESLTVGLETISTTKEGGYTWNDTVVKSHDEVDNEDGSRTYTIEIYDDLMFSDGSPVTAKDYIAFTMAFSTPVAAQAAGKDHMSAMSVVGFDTFNTYDGTEGTGTKELSGLRLLGDYSWSVTIAPDYLPYFYAITYAGFSAQYRPMWIGEADILDDGNGVYFSDDFYAKEGDDYVVAKIIGETALDTSNKYPYSGPWCVESYDDTDKSAVLVRNEFFKGNYEGTVPTIDKIVYKKVISETQLEDFKAGGLDVIAAITGGDATDEAIALADESEGKYIYTHYSRAGYGKLGFRADYGPVQFVEVRQAIALCMDRATFAKDFTGGYGGVVDGPYYTGSWMYKEAVNQGMLLNAYPTSADAAIAVLEENGWCYNADGSAYTDGEVRYKKVPVDYLDQYDLDYKSQDGAYTTVVDGDFAYLPLVINWYGTSNNEFTDLLVTGFMENDNVAAIGMKVYNQIGDFNPMLDELYQSAVYGYYSGSPMYSAFNFATGFNSAAYDYSWNWTIDPSMYEDYSACYVKDVADAFWLK